MKALSGRSSKEGIELFVMGVPVVMLVFSPT
jgi:hypothetical protein